MILGFYITQYLLRRMFEKRKESLSNYNKNVNDIFGIFIFQI